MAAQRKLLSEIDRTLKKVQEGLELFDDLWNKVHETEHGNQREKLEGDLKKEIKKLQRMREQIKAWITSTDIKDKQPLVDARKAIERDMERFKVLEKESKAKGFGGAGGNASKVDPKEAAKEGARERINNFVESLTSKVEECEYEMEELQANVKKKQKPPARLTELEDMVGKHKEHMSRLEKVLRCLDNDTVAPEEVTDLQSDMDIYLNGEPSEDGYGNVDDMYAPLLDRLEAVDNATPACINAAAAKHPRKEEDDRKDREREKERERERAAVAAAKAQLIAQGNTSVKMMDEEEKSKSGPTSVRSAVPGAPVSAAPAAASATAAPAVPGARPAPSTSREADGASTPLAVTPRSSQSTVPSSPGPFAMPPSTPQPLPEPPSPPPTTPPLPGQSPAPRPPAPGAPPPGLVALSPSTSTVVPGPAAVPGAALNKSTSGSWAAVTTGPSEPPAPVSAVGPAPAPAADHSKRLPTTKPPMPSEAPGLSPPVPPPVPGSTNGGGVPVGPPGGVPMPGKQPSTPAIPPAGASAAVPAGKPQSVVGPPQPPGFHPARPSNGVSDLTEARQSVGDESAEAADDASGQGLRGPKQGSVEVDRDAAIRAAAVASTSAPLPEISLPPVSTPYSTTAARHILEACFSRALPTSSDMDWKRYKPRFPTATPASFPKYPADVVDNPQLFRRMDPECLFFAFYYQPDTRQQYLAAQELKRQSWRFHKQHNAWFQRYTEPTVTSEEYEQGTYVYFDYNIMHEDMQTGWCYRRKENFTFKYDALEDELPASSS